MELDKNKNVEVSEVYSEQEEEEEETIIVDDGEKESDSNKTLEGFVTTLQQKPLDIISSNNSQFKQPAIPGTEERKESPQDEQKMIVYSVSEQNPEDMASIPSQEESKMPDEHGLLPQKDGECVN
uniref:Uncharacterized protein n=1 Tax=Megaselia scalaris TaxID=36166 RepID=T1GGH0_MEGSC